MASCSTVLNSGLVFLPQGYELRKPHKQRPVTGTAHQKKRQESSPLSAPARLELRFTALRNTHHRAGAKPCAAEAGGGHCHAAHGGDGRKKVPPMRGGPFLQITDSPTTANSTAGAEGSHRLKSRSLGSTHHLRAAPGEGTAITPPTATLLN